MSRLSSFFTSFKVVSNRNRPVFVLSVMTALLATAGSALGSDFIGGLGTVTPVASTVPAKGDLNPYGVAVVPATTGNLTKGNVLVSNFNNAGNLQGTGTTIVQITPGGSVSLFATIDAGSLLGSCPGGVGLTTALVALQSGWVIVGSLPTSDGTAATAEAGCLIVLNPSGVPVKTISGGAINGPWDMTALDAGSLAVLFISNVLNDTVKGKGHVVKKGTIVRIVLATGGAAPQVLAEDVIASGFGERTDPAALVIGPTGLGLGDDGALYVADTLANRVAAIPDAVFRTKDARDGDTVSQGGALNGPLGLAIAPNGDILVANGGDGNLVEISPSGSQVDFKTVNAAGAGSLFGLAITPSADGVYLVDDANNMLDLLH